MTPTVCQNAFRCVAAALLAIVALASPAKAQIYPVAVCVEVVPGIGPGRTHPSFIAHWGYFHEGSATQFLPKGISSRNYFSPGPPVYLIQPTSFAAGDHRTVFLMAINTDQTSTTADDFVSVSWTLDRGAAAASLPTVGSDGKVVYPTPLCPIEVTPIPVTVPGSGSYSQVRIARLTGDAGAQGVTLTPLGIPGDDGSISVSNLTYTPTSFAKGSPVVTTGTISADIQVNRVTSQNTLFGFQITPVQGNTPIVNNPVQVPISINPAYTCAIDTTANVAITLGGFSQNVVTHVYTQTVRVQNTSATAIAGPIVLALDNLSANATLTNATGTTSCSYPAGSPVLSISSGLAPGQTAAATLTFSNSASGQSITYTPRLLAGGTQQ